MAITLNGKRRTYRQMAFKKTRPNLDLGAEDIRKISRSTPERRGDAPGRPRPRSRQTSNKANEANCLETDSGVTEDERTGIKPGAEETCPSNYRRVYVQAWDQHRQNAHFDTEEHTMTESAPPAPNSQDAGGKGLAVAALDCLEDVDALAPVLWSTVAAQQSSQAQDMAQEAEPTGTSAVGRLSQ